MEQETNPNLFALKSDDGAITLINLNLVRMVDEIRSDHCRLVFSESHAVEIHGTGAQLLLSTLAARSVSMDGSPLKGLGENATSE